MKTLSVLLIQCFTALTSVAAHEAYLYTHDVQSRSSSPIPDAIDSETAYSIWARRLRQPEQRRLGSAGDFAIEQIDHHGGYQAPMLGDAHQQMNPARLSVVIEGYDDGTITPGTSSWFQLTSIKVHIDLSPRQTLSLRSPLKLLQKAWTQST